MQAKWGALHAASQPDHNKLATARPQMTFVSGEKKAPEKTEALFGKRKTNLLQQQHQKKMLHRQQLLLFYFTLLFSLRYNILQVTGSSVIRLIMIRCAYDKSRGGEY